MVPSFLTFFIFADYKIIVMSPLFFFFSLGKTTEGPAGATRGGLGRAAEGPRPSVQVPGLEPGRVRSPAGSGTNRATLVNIIFLLDGR